MNYKQILDNKLIQSQNTAASMQSFREYLESFKNKLLRWSSRTNDDTQYTTEALTICVTDQALGSVIAVVTPEQYQKCLTGEVDSVACKINDAGDTITLTADDLVTKVEDLANEASIQSAFISECLDSATVSAQSFITKIKSINDQIDGDAISKYADLLKSGDPIESLQSLFATVQLGTQSKKQIGANEYISIASANDFTGANILTVAWNNLWGTITSFFDVAWKGILHIGEFIQELFNGLVNCIKWLVKLVMRPLTTRYEKGNAPIGIMDLPLGQIELGVVSTTDRLNYHIDDLSDSLYDLISAWESDTVWRADTGRQPRCLTKQNDGTLLANDFVLSVDRATDNGRFMPYLNALASACLEEVDGQYYFRPYDIVVPTGYWDFIIRFGVSSDMKLSMLLYIAMPYSSITNISDKDIYDTICKSARGFFNTIAEMFPVIYGDLSFGFSISNVNNLWLKSNTDEDNVDIVALNYLFDNITSNKSSVTPVMTDTIKSFWCHFLLNGLLPYAIMMGPAYQNVLNNYHPGFEHDYWITKGDLLRLFLIDSADYTEKSSYNPLPVEYYETWPDTMDIVEYRPYVQSNLFGVSVHYQSLNEAANELLKYLVIIVIAAAAVFISVKWHKYKRKRQSLAEIRQGYVDNMAWNLPQNPSAAQLSAYQKAKKAAARTNRLNGILGISSPGKTAASTLSTVFSVRDALLSMQGANESGTGQSYTLSTLQQNIQSLIDQLSDPNTGILTAIQTISTTTSNVSSRTEILTGNVKDICIRIENLSNSIEELCTTIKDWIK